MAACAHPVAGSVSRRTGRPDSPLTGRPGRQFGVLNSGGPAIGCATQTDGNSNYLAIQSAPDVITL